MPVNRRDTKSLSSDGTVSIAAPESRMGRTDSTRGGLLTLQGDDDLEIQQLTVARGIAPQEHYIANLGEHRARFDVLSTRMKSHSRCHTARSDSSQSPNPTS